MALLKEDLAGEVRYTTSAANSHDISLRVFKQGGSLRYEIGVEMWPSAEGYLSWSQFCTNAELNDTLQVASNLTLPWEIPGGTVDRGVIVMWSGLLVNIPSGWVLCDGNNGTPDLRDKFVVGAAPLANPGATGGAANHSHTYSDVVNHVHVQNRNSGTTGSQSGYGIDTSTSGSAATGISTANPTGGVAQGTTDTADSRPPYYAVAFIQKI